MTAFLVHLSWCTEFACSTGATVSLERRTTFQYLITITSQQFNVNLLKNSGTARSVERKRSMQFWAVDRFSGRFLQQTCLAKRMSPDIKQCISIYDLCVYMSHGCQEPEFLNFCRFQHLGTLEHKCFWYTVPSTRLRSTYTVELWISHSILKYIRHSYRIL